MSSEPKSFSKEIISPILKCGNDKSCWGPKAWDALGVVCDVIPCETCRIHCRSMLSFERDVLNKLQGKQVFNPDNVQGHLQSIVDAFPETKTLKPRLIR